VSRNSLDILGPRVPELDRILTPGACEFLATLQTAFGERRQQVLAARLSRRGRFRQGELPDFLPETEGVRRSAWQVAPAPPDLDDRRVEITGPVERKMMINALNSGAQVFMADFEDALSPTWENVIGGQVNCQDAVRRTLAYTAPDGRAYQLNPVTATLVVRPRGWHLSERHVALNGSPFSASLFDFGLYFYHNAEELRRRGSGPYFYLPKLESHDGAQLWNDIFLLAQEALGLPRGTIRATVLIENMLAAFEMEEILHELREHAAGLNAGRWDYIFSLLKNFGHRPDFILPDRRQVGMTVPFMRAYTELLVTTCHRRGAHAIGGMAAFIPSRRDQKANEIALAKVTEDKQREAEDGFDGSWVAHPDLVPVARAVFDATLGNRPHQKHRRHEDPRVTAEQLLAVKVPDGTITTAGVRTNIKVALEYLANWLEGRGAVGIDNLMEDAATAEISRMQLNQWLRHRVRLEDGKPMELARYRLILGEEVSALRSRGDLARLDEAAVLLDRVVQEEPPIEFLTLPAYQLLA